jgi:hypothetical protein
LLKYKKLNYIAQWGNEIVKEWRLGSFLTNSEKSEKSASELFGSNFERPFRTRNWIIVLLRILITFLDRKTCFSCRTTQNLDSNWEKLHPSPSSSIPSYIPHSPINLFYLDSSGSFWNFFKQESSKITLWNEMVHTNHLNCDFFLYDSIILSISKIIWKLFIL